LVAAAAYFRSVAINSERTLVVAVTNGNPWQWQSNKQLLHHLFIFIPPQPITQLSPIFYCKSIFNARPCSWLQPPA
jgi:hypothetical protein